MDSPIDPPLVPVDLPSAAAGSDDEVGERRSQLAKASAVYQAMSSPAPLGFYLVDADFRLRLVSAGAQPVFSGVRPLIGRDFAEVLRVVWPEPFASEALVRFRHTLATGEPHRAPNTVERRADVDAVEAYDWTIERVTLPNGEVGVVCQFYDLTERQRYADALQKSEERYRTLFEAMDEGFCVIEVLFDEGGRPLDYRFLEINPAFEKQTGLTDAIGRTIRELAPDQDEHWFETYGRVALTGESTRFENYSRPLERWFDVFCFRVGRPDSRHVAVLFKDITQRRAADTELRAARDAAQAANRAKDDFLAALSHELRTPLTPVLMIAEELCEDPSMSPQVVDRLCEIRRNVALEARLIDDLLDLTRVSHGKLSLREENCDVHSLVVLALEIVRDEAQAKGIVLKVELAAQRTAVRCDSSRIQQVFWNLLKNAVKFTLPGGRIVIRSYDQDEGFVLEVRDNGIGIEPEGIGRIFQPFEQVERGNEHRFGGLGLGLSIARALVELHGGSISAESEGLNRGATFRVQLRASDYPATPRPADSTPGGPETSAGPETRSLRLLLVEDHEPTLTVLTRLLSRAGHDVRTATSVAAARELAAAEPFDGVISDIGLPDGTGIELMSHLREKHGLRGIALSGYGMEQDQLLARESGFVAHITKPADFDQLRRALRTFTESTATGNS
jgi:PAS domain S-box-containing protein